MKTTFTVFFISLAWCSVLSAQNFLPFQPEAVAVYTTSPVPGEISSLAIVSTEVIEDDTVYDLMKTFDSENGDLVEPEDEDCGSYFWATAGMCFPQNIPQWLGAEIRKTADEIYEFTTAGGDILTFDFGLEAGDSAVIYQNEDMQLYLKADGESAGNYLGIEQSTLNFHLLHFSSAGEPSASSLHLAPITIGADLGAVEFMRIDRFPEVLQPISLCGHSGSGVGYSQVRSAEVFDFQPGDVFQYFNHEIFNPFETESFYETHTVLERSESETTISYTVNIHRFTPDSAVNEVFNEAWSVSKSAVLGIFPFEDQEVLDDGSGSYTPNGCLIQDFIFANDSCGSAFTYSQRESFFHNCPGDEMSCYGNTLHISPEEYYYAPSEWVYKQGLGLTYSSSGTAMGSGGLIAGVTRELIYSSKNGIECGNEIVLDVDYYIAENQLRAYPNPTTGIVKLSGQILQDIKTTALYDLTGNLLWSEQLPASDVIDLSSFPPGIYVLQIHTKDNERLTQKLVKY